MIREDPMKRLRKIQASLTKIGAGDGADGGDFDAFRAGYDALSTEERLALFDWMTTGLEVDRDVVLARVSDLLEGPPLEGAEWVGRLKGFRDAVASPRRRLLENLIDVPGGMKFVLELRAEVLEAERAGAGHLATLDQEIADLLTSWCRHGFLFLEEIDRNSSYSKIRYLKERELVHPMVSLEEMGLRLGEDRMCFALCHVVMPDEPVVFIEVALSRGLVRSIHDIIGDRDQPRKPLKSPDTAIFYSINNTQNGLTGLGLGKVLIFRVTEALRQRHPGVKTLATLSPIPGFRSRYLEPILTGAETRFALDRDAALDLLSPSAGKEVLAWHQARGGEGSDLGQALAAVLAEPSWIEERSLVRHLKRPLVELAYRYVAVEKDAGGKPINPVAGFHLGNGATLAKKNVNFAANTSPRGMLDSCGLMVNYVYSPSTFQKLGRTVMSLIPWGRR
jgi:hypothetical protein